MSIELALIPIAIAIAGRVGSRKKRARELPNSFCLETQFKDGAILQASLEDYGCRSIFTGSKVDSYIGGTQIIFEPSESGVFDAVFVGNIAIEHAQAFIADLHDEYTKRVQREVYQKLISRAKDRGLLLESEAVQDDNSIVLTFAI
ncbi:MAG TPA: hypothetical protein VH482_18745 [Thermomicrobiales bacterium]|jgi:hypothetical protein